MIVGAVLGIAEIRNLVGNHRKSMCLVMISTHHRSENSKRDFEARLRTGDGGGSG